MFRSTHSTILRGLICRTLCCYWIRFRWFAFFDCLCSMWLYVLIVSFVCMSGALVRVRSGYGITKSHPDKSTSHTHTHTHTHTHKTDDKHIQPLLSFVCMSDALVRVISGYSVTRSHPDKSTSHTRTKLTISTYSHSSVLCVCLVLLSGWDLVIP